MQNEIWERVGQFLNTLRCENVTRDTAVNIPGYKDTQNELEELNKKCRILINQMLKEEQKILLEWMTKQEDMNSLEGQKAYCQGYVDCILMLSGFGLLRQDLVPIELMKSIR